MRQVRRDLDLTEEPVLPEGRGDLGPQDLDGDVALVFQVLGQVDERCPAPADLAHESVTPTERLGEPITKRRRRLDAAGPGRSGTQGSCFAVHSVTWTMGAVDIKIPYGESEAKVPQ